jgi:hypothetical protein
MSRAIVGNDSLRPILDLLRVNTHERRHTLFQPTDQTQSDQNSNRKFSRFYVYILARLNILSWRLWAGCGRYNAKLGIPE